MANDALQRRLRPGNSRQRISSSVSTVEPVAFTPAKVLKALESISKVRLGDTTGDC